jgi:acyl carrier protein
LNEVGLDSLRSVALANELEDEFGVLVSISELISGPTVAAASVPLTVRRVLAAAG